MKINTIQFYILCTMSITTCIFGMDKSLEGAVFKPHAGEVNYIRVSSRKIKESLPKDFEEKKKVLIETLLAARSIKLYNQFNYFENLTIDSESQKEIQNAAKVGLSVAKKLAIQATKLPIDILNDYKLCWFHAANNQDTIKKYSRIWRKRTHILKQK